MFQRTRTNNPKIYMEPQKTQNCQSNAEEKEQSWRHNAPRLKTILQSYSDQNSMVLAQKQTYRSMEQNREPRNKPTHLWLVNLQQRRQEYTMGKWQSLQQVMLGKLDSCMYINEVRTHPHTIQKNKLKMAWRLKYKTWRHKTPRREHTQNIFWHKS